MRVLSRYRSRRLNNTRPHSDEALPASLQHIGETALTVSDAIENELSKLEVTHRSLLFTALRGIATLGAFIVRPESMTAYATLAAAFAAFLAVKAAERQERATFTSALCAKQVDVTAIVQTKLRQFLDLGQAFWPRAESSPIARSYFVIHNQDPPGDYHTYATDEKFRQISTTFDELISSIDASNCLSYRY
jgi:hypothetical protein